MKEKNREELLAVLGKITDIVKFDLNQPEEILKEFGDMIPGFLFIVDFEHIENSYLNTYGHKALGYSRDDLALMGLEWWTKVVHPDHHLQVQEVIQFFQDYPKKQYANLHKVITRKGQELLLYSVIKPFWYDDSGKVARVIGVSLPIGPKDSDTFKKHFLGNEPFIKKNGNTLAGLSKREKEILELISKDFKASEIAMHLGISEHTVNSYRNKLLKKLNVKTKAGLVVFAAKMGLV